MQRKFEEKREITESISRTICDICGDIVMDKPFIRLYATDDSRPSSRDDSLEVCTPACLEKNIKGIRCVLDGKMIPGADTGIREKNYATEKCEDVEYKKSPKIYIPISIGK